MNSFPKAYRSDSVSFPVPHRCARRGENTDARPCYARPVAGDLFAAPGGAGCAGNTSGIAVRRGDPQSSARRASMRLIRWLVKLLLYIGGVMFWLVVLPIVIGEILGPKRREGPEEPPEDVGRGTLGTRPLARSCRSHGTGQQAFPARTARPAVADLLLPRATDKRTGLPRQSLRASIDFRDPRLNQFPSRLVTTCLRFTPR